ncbi:MAG: LacI family DNA-binding transcriptional regulator [Opitutales bacterium]|nr:LacI family DNA-binding transcriptional regulator [Opitutales bacterium]
MKVTQQEIADQLNLSRTTVSRCFTNHPKINPETRSQVFQLANQLGYSYSAPRNVRERSAQGKCQTIAVLVGLPKDQIATVDTASQILDGISERAAASKMAIQIHYIDPDSFTPGPKTRRIVKNINISEWAGALMLYPFASEAVKNLMSRIPTLSILDDYDDLGLDCVEPDQHHGINLVMDRLISLGHTNIGFISWKYKIRAKWVERRLGTYLEHMYLSSLEINPANIVNVLPGPALPLDELVAYVARRTREGVTAWVCAADHQAYHLLVGLQKHGIRVPQDCSVTGFDGVLPPEGLPQLTTVAVSLKDVGFSAVHELERKMREGSPKCRHVMVAGKLVTGETTAFLPKSR